MAQKWKHHNYDTPNMGVKKHGVNTSTLNGSFYTNPRSGFDKSFYKQQANKGIITFGKHRGKHISKVPYNYLKWMLINLDATEHRELLKQIQKQIIT